MNAETVARSMFSDHPTRSRGISLSKITLQNMDRSQSQTAKQVWPWYPLAGHREGLAANDMITLHSAFVILAMEGGTVEMTMTPGTIFPGTDQVVPFRN